MRNLFIKIFLFFAFILSFITCADAAGMLNINSVTFDNSASFISINSKDINDFSFSQKPEIKSIEGENTVYFDIPSAIMECASQNLIIKSSDISQVNVFQYSQNPDIVRVQISYKDNFNPQNIKLKKVGNTLFVQFKYPSINNYYFQSVSQDSNVQSFVEQTEIQTKVPEQSLFGQINNSFGGDYKTDKFSIIDKNLLLKTKYYLDEVSFIGTMPVITGIGTYTISKPMYLSNPSRVVFDIPNSIVNPMVRNQEISINEAENLRIGQFDSTTTRIVITSPNPEKFIPVIYPDSQRLVFFDSKNVSPLNLYATETTLKDITYDEIDKFNHSLKFVFNKPLILGINRKQNETVLCFYNMKAVDFFKELESTPFDKAKIANNCLILHNENGIDIHLGTNGKTLRIKEKFKTAYTSVEVPEVVVPSLPEKLKGKRYVLIDPGHGGTDVGATRNNIYEKDLTLDIAKRVESLLKKKGYIVEMTRFDDRTLSLQERVDISELFNPDVFVSIHINSSNSEKPYGLETHYYKENSLMLAKYVHAALLNNINTNNRGLFKSKFYVINHTTAPAVLVEAGFISNPSERSQLVSESRKNATAKAIAEGIDEYFKQF